MIIIAIDIAMKKSSIFKFIVNIFLNLFKIFTYIEVIHA